MNWDRFSSTQWVSCSVLPVNDVLDLWPTIALFRPVITFMAVNSSNIPVLYKNFLSVVRSKPLSIPRSLFSTDIINSLEPTSGRSDIERDELHLSILMIFVDNLLWRIFSFESENRKSMFVHWFSHSTKHGLPSEGSMRINLTPLWINKITFSLRSTPRRAWIVQCQVAFAIRRIAHGGLFILDVVGIAFK